MRTSTSSRTGSARARADVLHRRGILERREIAEVGLAEVRAADDAPQDLRVARLRELRDEAHRLGPEWFPEELGDLVLDLAREGFAPVSPGPAHAEHDDARALDLVRHADGRGLAHGRVRDGGRLDLRRPDALSGDL